MAPVLQPDNRFVMQRSGRVPGGATRPPQRPLSYQKSVEVANPGIGLRGDEVLVEARRDDFRRHLVDVQFVAQVRAECGSAVVRDLVREPAYRMLRREQAGQLW